MDMMLDRHSDVSIVNPPKLVNLAVPNFKCARFHSKAEPPLLTNFRSSQSWPRYNCGVLREVSGSKI